MSHTKDTIDTLVDQLKTLRDIVDDAKTELEQHVKPENLKNLLKNKGQIKTRTDALLELLGEQVNDIKQSYLISSLNEEVGSEPDEEIIENGVCSDSNLEVQLEESVVDESLVNIDLNESEVLGKDLEDSNKENDLEDSNKENEISTEETSNQTSIGLNKDQPGADTGGENDTQVNPVKTETIRFIKPVDFNKLVDPDKLAFMNDPDKEKPENNSSIIILSSSEDETSISKSKRKSKTEKNSTKNVKDTRKLNEAIKNCKVDTRRNSKVSARAGKSGKVEKLKLVDDDSDSENIKNKEPLTNQKESRKASQISKSVKSSNNKDNKFQSDVEFKAKKCHVKLLRIPCEKLKEFYKEQKSISEINRLCNLNTIKKTNGKEKNIDSVSSSNTSTRDKKKESEKSNMDDLDKPKLRDDEQHENDADHLKLNSPDLFNTSAPDVDIDSEVVNNILDTLKDADEQSDKDSLKNQDLETKIKEKTRSKNGNKSQDGGSDKEDSNKKKSKVDKKTNRKKKWKKDNLLTDGLSSGSGSDSKEAAKKKNKLGKEKEKQNSLGSDSEGSSKNKENVKDRKKKPDSENETDTEVEGDKEKNEKVKSSEENEDSDTQVLNVVTSDSSDEEPKKSHKSEEKKKDSSSSSSDSEVFAKYSDKKDKKFRNKRKEAKSSEDEVHKSTDEEDEDDDDVIKTRRKPKKKTVRIVSEDSDDDEKQEEKKSKKRKKHHESDDSKKSDESDGDKSDESDNEKKKAKRKRIKRPKDDSSSESDNANSTRRKLKRVLGKSELSDTTRKAEAAEKQRKARILEKQKKYNEIFGNTLLNASVDKVVLDMDEETKKPLLEVEENLVKKLKPHQANGVQFMWDACFESLKRAKDKKGSGCILAHCMGLGKTLQVITLSHVLMMNDEITGIKKVLVVCPLSTVLNWKAEYKNWLPEDDQDDITIYEVASMKTNAERSRAVQNWHRSGGVFLISYAMFRNVTNPKNKKISSKFRNAFQTGFVDPGPDLVICDEGHLLKNEKTALSVAMCRIRTHRRIILTGTPLQNNLKEYYCMVQFVKPNLLGTYREYLNRFVNPITNGQYIDSTALDIQVMRRRSHVLHKLLDGIVQRRDYSVLEPYLPPKFDYVLFLSLTDVQHKLYCHYMEHMARQSKSGTAKTSYLFQDFQTFQRICSHPRVLADRTEPKDKFLDDSEEEDSEGSLKEFIDDARDTSSSKSSSSSSDLSGSEDSDSNKKKKVSSRRRVTRGFAANTEDGEDLLKPEQVKEWWHQYCDGEELDNISHSSKLLLLFEILKECEQIGDKVLVFSQSLYSLNVIEFFLNQVDEATQSGDSSKTAGYTGSWDKGLDYFRLDGSTDCSNRSAWCKIFNDPDNTRARLFLLSTRAGGLGINLVGANRVILYDVSWNPSNDVQSIYRVYRFGQLKPSYVYRFVTYGTMEMKIYERQVTKQAISKRVIDEQQIDRHYNQNDLAELYKYENPGIDERPIPLVPKDVLLGEMLQKHEGRIFKYHEHQSLLENKRDEELNEEERKAAWDEFENEKIVRQTTVYPTIQGLDVRSIQAALRSIIQKDNPTWNNQQIVSIMPQLVQQLQMQINSKDYSMFSRIQQEITRMQQEYVKKMKENHYKAQMAKFIQSQQKLLGAAIPGLLRNMPGAAMPAGTSAAAGGFPPGSFLPATSFLPANPFLPAGPAGPSKTNGDVVEIND